MRYLFAVRFRTRKNGANSGFDDTKSFRTVANSPKAAAQKMRKKGEVLSVRKVKKIAP